MYVLEGPETESAIKKFLKKKLEKLFFCVFSKKFGSISLGRSSTKGSLGYFLVLHTKIY